MKKICIISLILIVWLGFSSAQMADNLPDAVGPPDAVAQMSIMVVGGGQTGGGGGGGGTVAVEGSTYSTVETANADSNTDVTIPAGANLAIIGVSGYGSYPEVSVWSNGSMTLDSQSCTNRVAYDSDNEAQMTAIFTCSGFTSGASKTLAWDWVGASAVEAAHIFIIFVSGADTSDPVRSSGGEIEKASDNTATTGSMSAQSGDYVFAVVNTMDTGTPSVNWTGATMDSQSSETNYAECAEASPSGNVTVSTTCTDCANYMSLSAVVIQPE
jgi:hypothetical protein